MRLNLYRVDGGYLLCPAGVPVPGPHAAELEDRRPDLQLLSRETAGRQFIEDHMRNNGAVVLDEAVADLMLAGCRAWVARSFQRSCLPPRRATESTPEPTDDHHDPR